MSNRITKYHRDIAAYQDSLMRLNGRLLYTISNLRSNTLYAGQTIKIDTLYQYRNKEMKLFPRHELFQGNEIFVIRYNPRGCNSCISLLFRNQKFLDKMLSKIKVYVLVDFKYSSEIEAFQKENITNDVEFIWFNENRDISEIDQSYNNKSYCFFMSKSGIIRSLFAPDYAYAEDINHYVDLQFQSN